jgi:Sortase domain
LLGADGASISTSVRRVAVRHLVANLVFVTILVCGLMAAALGAAELGPAGTETVTSHPQPPRSSRLVGASKPAPLLTASVSPPVRLLIPAIGVDTALQSLQLSSDGSLQVPTAWQTAGWYSDGVRPGQPGPAVIAGHVDSTDGPAVFFQLRQLQHGDQIIVLRQDRHQLVFVVDAVNHYPKKSFPTELVYGMTPLPELRLITCGGDFDRKALSYLDNVVVSAHLM